MATPELMLTIRPPSGSNGNAAWIPATTLRVVDGELPLDGGLVDGLAVEQAATAHGRVVDQNVQLPELLDHAPDQAGRLRRVRLVGLEGRRAHSLRLQAATTALARSAEDE
nr:hypothetical protein [Actinomadura madurae]